MLCFICFLAFAKLLLWESRLRIPSRQIRQVDREHFAFFIAKLQINFRLPICNFAKKQPLKSVNHIIFPFQLFFTTFAQFLLIKEVSQLCAYLLRMFVTLAVTMGICLDTYLNLPSLEAVEILDSTGLPLPGSAHPQC